MKIYWGRLAALDLLIALGGIGIGYGSALTFGDDGATIGVLLAVMFGCGASYLALLSCIALRD